MEAVLKDIVMADLYYFDNDNCNNLGTSFIVPSNMFSINCNSGSSSYHISDGFMQKSHTFKDVEICFYKPKNNPEWSFIYSDTIKAIKDFLYVDKWTECSIRLYCAGKTQFTRVGDECRTLYFRHGGMSIIELSEEDKKNGVIAKIIIMDVFTN
jgi:hypothetical protein